MATSSSIVSLDEEDSAHLADESSSSTTLSLLDHLLSPEPSDCARKRKAMENTFKGKRKSHGDSVASSSNQLTINGLKNNQMNPFLCIILIYSVKVVLKKFVSIEQCQESY